MTKSLLGKKTHFAASAAFSAMSADERVEYQRHEATAHGYAWGQMDAGHPPVVTITEGEPPTTTDTAWAFGSLYARMQAEINDPNHPRRLSFAVQTAWEIFASTGCPSGDLPSTYPDLAEAKTVVKPGVDLSPRPPLPHRDETQSLLRYLGANVDTAAFDGDLDAVTEYEKLYAQAQRLIDARASTADFESVMEHLLARREANKRSRERYANYTALIVVATALSVHLP